MGMNLRIVIRRPEVPHLALARGMAFVARIIGLGECRDLIPVDEQQIIVLVVAIFYATLKRTFYCLSSFGDLLNSTGRRLHETEASAAFRN